MPRKELSFLGRLLLQSGCEFCAAMKLRMKICTASQNFELWRTGRESSADRSQRLASQNARTLANRDRESSAERSQRLASQNSRTLANRDRESSAERSQRLTQQNARSTRNRTRRQHNLLNAALLMIVPLTILS
ncbi:hypothetical protein EVAR_49869_1 [Eumeta japonica]|uniref:Uncharacterized protein n=1 Tax=Eumeta variegata TaxID=151549 RepID=A0A4C1XWM9_EUMVA|nr:hypothetical protein EVAR_49869_1 [Eumeta japonica]